MLCQLSSSWTNNCSQKAFQAAQKALQAAEEALAAAEAALAAAEAAVQAAVEERKYETPPTRCGSAWARHLAWDGCQPAKHSSKASKAQQHSPQNRKTIVIHKTYKPYSSAISVFASAFATHENPTHPPKPPTTGQNPQQPVNKKPTTRQTY